jgi:hypothetical protein
MANRVLGPPRQLVGGPLGGVDGERAARWRGQRDSAEPIPAVDIGRMDVVAHERPGAAGDHGNIVAAEKVQELQRIPGRARKRNVPRHGDDGEDVELGRGACEEERERIVEAGIGVDDDAG